MSRPRKAALWMLGLGIAFAAAAAAQEPVPATPDPVLAAAQDYLGRALILRAFPAAAQFEYDEAGHLKAPGKVVDWTLAGMDLAKVTRHGANQLELDGLRVAIRYNPDNHLFSRHPLKDQPLRILFPAADARTVARTMDAIFSTGIDPSLQRSMPPYWQHYFLPVEPWNDGLTAILPASGPFPPGTQAPVAEKEPEPDYTAEARTDRVKGLVSLRLVVDPTGAVRRVAIRQPLGYGLDAEAVKAVQRFRFQPGTVNGTPAAMEVIVNQTFDFAAPPAF